MTGARISPAVLVLTGALTPGGGPEISRGTGQRLAQRELAEQTVAERVFHWLSRLVNGASRDVPGGWLGLVVLVILAVLLITAVVFSVQPGLARTATWPVLAGGTRSARDHRRDAERLAEAGDYTGAIVEGVRAIAAELVERGILPPRPGRTADELAVEAGGELPGLATDLRAVALLFDDVRYGGRAGSQAGYELVSKADQGVRSARVPRDRDAELAGADGAPR